MDLQHLFSNSIFFRWTAVPAFYNDKNLYQDDNTSMSSAGVPDAWIVAPYLNDGIPRLVVAWPHGHEYSAFTVDAAKLLTSGQEDITQNDKAVEAKLSNATLITSALKTTNYNGKGLPVYRRASLSNCIGSVDPLQAPTGVDTDKVNSTSAHCSTANLDHIHIPPDDFSHFLKSSQLGSYDSILTATTVAFSTVDGVIETLYLNTDSDIFAPNNPALIGRLPSSMLIRVVRFSPTDFRDQCLLIAGSSADLLNAKNGSRKR